MKSKRLILIIIVLVLTLLVVNFTNNCINNTIIKNSKVNIVEELNKNFDDAIKEINQIKVDSVENINIKDNSRLKEKLGNVIGKIVIDKLNLNYPILEGSTEENLNISITRFYGSKINNIGNCVLAGHNMKDGSLFGRLSEVSKGDNISLYDSLGNKINYKVFNIIVVNPKELSILSQETKNSRWITLITCTVYGNNRLIVQAKECSY